MASTPSSSFESMNMNIWIYISFQRFSCYTRRLLLHLKVHSQCLCTGGFKFPHHTCGSWILDHDWLQTICDVTNPAGRYTLLNWIFKEFRETFHFQQMNVETNSVQTSFCTEKIKRPTVERRKAYFRVDGNFKYYRNFLITSFNLNVSTCFELKITESTLIG